MLFTVTGPGYGIELNAGAIFRNASGIASGESLQYCRFPDYSRRWSLYSSDQGSSCQQYTEIYCPRHPEPNRAYLISTSPKHRILISVSNRIYGSLELHATAYGAPVNYTCSGANPLLLHGDLRIGDNVSMSMNLSGSNGNIQIEGDFIQEGGQFNLASGSK